MIAPAIQQQVLALQYLPDSDVSRRLKLSVKTVRNIRQRGHVTTHHIDAREPEALRHCERCGGPLPCLPCARLVASRHCKAHARADKHNGYTLDIKLTGDRRRRYEALRSRYEAQGEAPQDSITAFAREFTP